jgi:hypothetical protein
MPFRIIRHTSAAIIEVVYPSHPNEADVAQYLAEIRRAMVEAFKVGPWSCLVDQRELKLMDPKLMEHIVSMNAFARTHGMKRSARVVDGALAKLQAGRIARTTEAGDTVRSFDSRDDALAWLQSA